MSATELRVSVIDRIDSHLTDENVREVAGSLGTTPPKSPEEIAALINVLFETISQDIVKYLQSPEASQIFPQASRFSSRFYGVITLDRIRETLDRLYPQP